MVEYQDQSWVPWQEWLENPLVHPYELADFILCPENDSDEIKNARRWLEQKLYGGENGHLVAILKIPEVQRALRSMCMTGNEFWYARQIYNCCKDLPYHGYYGL